MRDIKGLTPQTIKRRGPTTKRIKKSVLDKNVIRFYGQPNITGCQITNKQKAIPRGSKILDEGKRLTWVEPAFVGTPCPSDKIFKAPESLPRAMSDYDYRKHIRSIHYETIRKMLSGKDAYNIQEIIEASVGRIRTELEESEVKRMIADMNAKFVKSEMGEKHYYILAAGQSE